MDEGGKMNLLKKAMKDILKILHKDDRLCLIEFDHRGLKLCPLMRVTRKNKREFNKIIHKFEAKGGTSINAGMEQAFLTIKNRRYKNPCTGIFLLSDGLDGGADSSVN
jgi:uncharacterized protein with von Willebrand factor type A (vWA) domain